jgi:hypothetical protein
MELLMGMKFNPVSPAKAFTMRVLPVPEGPDKRMPRDETLPTLKSSGYFSGQSTMEMSVSLILASPPTSLSFKWTAR